MRIPLKMYSPEIAVDNKDSNRVILELTKYF